MRAKRQYLWALLFLGTPASAHALDRGRAASPVSGRTLSAAAVRAAAPYGIISSAFRTVEHNRAVGGVPDSYHLLGQAIDVVRRPGVSHAQIAAALTAAGFHLIESLDEGDHSHFAFGPPVRHGLSPAPPAPALPRPQPAPKILVAADEHGTLRLDLGPAPAARTKPRTGSSGPTAAH
jgi:hypothetical protein